MISRTDQISRKIPHSAGATHNLTRTMLAKSSADAFNKCFSSIAKKLDNEIPYTQNSPINYLSLVDRPNSFFLTPVTTVECACHSKIFERCIMNRLMKFCAKYLILSPHQYGFRSGNGTVDAIISFCEDIYHNLNNRMPISVFVDLLKAFDGVNHAILLKKLSCYIWCPRRAPAVVCKLPNRSKVVCEDTV